MKQSERITEHKIRALSKMSERVKTRQLTEYGKDMRRVYNDLCSIPSRRYARHGRDRVPSDLPERKIGGVMTTTRLTTQEIVAGLRRLGIPEYEMDAAVQSFHKWEADCEKERQRNVWKALRGRKMRRMM